MVKAPARRCSIYKLGNRLWDTGCVVKPMVMEVMQLYLSEHIWSTLPNVS